MSLGSNHNVYNTCLRILRARGFDLKVEGELEADGSIPTGHFWVASKGESLFRGENPIELLGLTAIFDYKQPAEDGPYWWVVEGDDIVSELYDVAWGPFAP